MAKLVAGKEEDVWVEIRKPGQIREANATYGAYDLIIKANFQNIEEIDKFVFDVLRRVPGISETVTIYKYFRQISYNK